MPFPNWDPSFRYFNLLGNLWWVFLYGFIFFLSTTWSDNDLCATKVQRYAIFQFVMGSENPTKRAKTCGDIHPDPPKYPYRCRTAFIRLIILDLSRDLKYIGHLVVQVRGFQAHSWLTKSRYWEKCSNQRYTIYRTSSGTRKGFPDKTPRLQDWLTKSTCGTGRSRASVMSAEALVLSFLFFTVLVTFLFFWPVFAC